MNLRKVDDFKKTSCTGMAIGIIALCFSSEASPNTQEPDVEPGDHLPRIIPDELDWFGPPEPVDDKKVLYLEIGERGETLRLRLNRTARQQWEIYSEQVPKKELDELEQQYLIVTERSDRATIDDLVGRSPITSSSSSSCPLPSAFSIVGDSSGNAIGGVDFHGTGRPPGTNTQWLSFDFYTTNYSGSNSHAPLVLRHEDTLHGWGAFLGDNSGSPDGCTGNPHTTQIEGWVVYGTSGVPGPLWQSNTFPNSCGNQLVDGRVTILPGVGLPRYRMVIHAASSKWAAYEVMEYDRFSGWITHTPWTSLNTASQGSGTGWPFPPPPYNLNAEGIFVGATDSLSGVPNWQINFSNVNCGWF
jgi:hypothetical protein